MSRRDLLDNDRYDRVLSPRATRIGLLILIPVAVVFGVQTISWAVPKIWAQGNTLTADDLNQNFKDLEDRVTTLSTSNKALEDKVAALSTANAWVKCGKLEDLRAGANRCQIAAFPVDQYEYGFKYNTAEVTPATCTFWNVGLRIFNRDPYMVSSDDPTAAGAMALGGALFYTETNATDDDIPSPCASGTWRHRYWRIVGGSLDPTGLGTNGCVNLDLFCRRR
jgi:hypothetical protein